MKKLLFLLLPLVILPYELYASSILQHANADNGHITIEQVRASGIGNRWLVFHFGAPPVAVRAQVQSWANARREHYRADSPGHSHFRWYFVAKNSAGDVLDSGFLFDNNNQIAWDNAAQFLSPEEMQNVSVGVFHGHGSPIVLTPGTPVDDRRAFMQRWVNTLRREHIAGTSTLIHFESGQLILVRDGNTGLISDVGFTAYAWNSGTSDITAPISWLGL